MQNTFTDLLASKEANKERDLSLFGRLVGEWDFDWSAPQENGTLKTHKGEWVFSYVLEGNAVQDVFICPSRATREADPDEQAEYGTTFRLPLQDGSGKWQVLYACDQGRPFDRLTAEEKNGDIIQTGTPADESDTNIWRWNFRNITENTFYWEAVWSSDQGKTWNICCQLDASRRK